MDVPPSAGAAPDDHLRSEPDEPTAAELAARLDAVEKGLRRLGDRMEALVTSLEASVQGAVATEVHAAAAELRHTVSELGRILVRDLGKLPQMLTQHRQAIVAELRGTGVASGTRGGRAPVVPAAPTTESPPTGRPMTGRPMTDRPMTDDPPVEVAAADGDGPPAATPVAEEYEPDMSGASSLPGDDDGDDGAGGDGAGGDRTWRDHLRRHRQA